MIKIQRTPEPKFFSSEKLLNAKRLLEEKFGNAESQKRIRFNLSILAPIKKDLLKMCNDKCVYCESKVNVTSRGDIENFRPKAGAKGLNPKEYAPNHYWWLAYEWENLLISCQICNQKFKKDFFPLENESDRSPIEATGEELLNEHPLLIDPTLIDPSEHIEFNEEGVAIELSKIGKVTIKIIGLNRNQLVKGRIKAANQLKDKLEIMDFTKDYTNPFTKDFVSYINGLLSDSPSQEYVAIQRSIFDKWYESNSSKWENVKAKQNDKSETKRTIRKSLSENYEQTNEIKEVETQLTALKRFSIKSIEIVNFKSIEKLSLNIPSQKKSVSNKFSEMTSQEEESKESWLLLLGDNGVGKSSILQAIALALSSKKQLEKMSLNVLSYLKRGKRKGKVVIKSYEHDEPITLHFDKNGFKTDLKEALCFTLAYGSTRLMPKGKIKPDKFKEPYFNIRNLFDYSIALNDPNKWLGGIDSKEFDERVAPAFFDLLTLKDDDRLYVTDKKIVIRQYGQDYELEENSDGYKSITALVSDIMQTLSLEKANYHNSHGIVLIDEIGSHLHPRWRLKIVSALRKAFPKLQFIVTSHEPLCLRGLGHGEVVVLVRDEDNKVKALDQELLPDHNLLRVEQLLTSDLFGLINVMDEETEKTYEDYYNLLGKPVKERTDEEEEKLKQYASTLPEYETFGSTPEMQATYNLVKKTYNKMREEGFKTAENLKEETLNEVQDIIDREGLDWL